MEGVLREKYSDFNVKHFHEKLTEEHEITLSYTWVKTALQEAGLIARRNRGGPHRKRRPRRPMEGMLLHLDGSTHPWLTLCPDRQDDTRSSMTLLRDCVKKHGIFCALCTDRGSHFALTPKEGGPVDRSRPTQIGRALNELHIESIYAYSPQARGRSERVFGTWQGRLPQELRLRGIKDRETADGFGISVPLAACCPLQLAFENLRFEIDSVAMSLDINAPGISVRIANCRIVSGAYGILGKSHGTGSVVTVEDSTFFANYLGLDLQGISGGAAVRKNTMEGRTDGARAN